MSSSGSRYSAKYRHKLKSCENVSVENEDLIFDDNKVDWQGDDIFSTNNSSSCASDDSVSLETEPTTDVVDFNLEKCIETKENCLTVDVDISHYDLPMTSVENENVHTESSNPATSPETFRTFVENWAREYKIKHYQLSPLLNGLNLYLHTNLPKDPRTILKTCRTTNVEYVSDADGNRSEFIYLGLSKGLLPFLSCDLIRSKIKNNVLSLIFNIDGVPVSESPPRSFWPILGKIHIENFNIHPFPIAIFFGKSKPYLSTFLEDFIEELNDLLLNGLIYQGQLYKITILCFTCDAPARAFIKGIKSHNGHYACERCTQKGVHTQGRMTLADLDAEERTNDSFRNQRQKEHHVKSTPLINIKELHMTKHFALDYMHLCCIGVMKKLLRYWIKEVGTKLHIRDRTSISENLKNMTTSIPSEFNRKPRSLDEFENWKATELRLFLLYVGVVVLKNVLPKRMYQHFLLFHCALRILLSQDRSPHNIICAKKLLRAFVETFPNLYGPTSVVYNVHCISHISDDVENLRLSLNDLSCFSFESFLGRLVNSYMIRTPYKKLSQVVKRLSEKNLPLCYVKDQRNTSHQRLFLGNFMLSTLQSKDSFVLLANSIIVKMYNITGNIIFGRKCITVTEFFDYPFSSMKVGVYKFTNISDNVVSFEKNDIICKLLVIQNKSDSIFTAIEMLHTSDQYAD